MRGRAVDGYQCRTRTLCISPLSMAVGIRAILSLVEKMARSLLSAGQCYHSISCHRLRPAPLSTPSAAEGGCRRPVFTEGQAAAVL